MMSSHVYIFSPLYPISKWKSTVKNIDSKLLDYSDLRLMQILVIGDAFLDVS